MKINLTEMLYALSFALDEIENEVGGISTGHGKNVAYLSFLMGKEAGYKDDDLRDLVGLAILHDNAFTEYIREEYGDLARNGKVRLNSADKSLDKYLHGYDHSLMGEENIKLIPFRSDVKNVILYHHENANGSGPFKKKAKSTNLKAQIIHLADIIDVKWDILHMDENTFNNMMRQVNSSSDKAFSHETLDLLNKSLTYENIKDIQKNSAITCLRRDVITKEDEYNDKEIKNIALFFARIVDYKSSFTMNHSLGVAKRCEIMAKYYKFDKEKSIKFYLAGALHDIGKLCVKSNVLEKSDKLSKEEFEEVKEHAEETHRILSYINGMDDICRWASNHHERLDGLGYPRGLKAKDLSFEDRLLACIDIYQALVEKRPYKEGIEHSKTIAMMKQMAYDNKIDASIVKDIDIAMKDVKI